MIFFIHAQFCILTKKCMGEYSMRYRHMRFPGGKMKAVTVRNRTAIDRSDLCIFYAKEAHRNAGPFSMAMKYAKKSDCIIMDLYEEYDNSTYARLFNEQTKQ